MAKKIIKIVLIILAAYLLFFFFEGKTTHLESLNTGYIDFGEKKIHLYIAETPDQHEKGLSHVPLSRFKKNEGMLFVFDKEEPRQFWMKDMLFDLDIFFMDREMNVLWVNRNEKVYRNKVDRTDIVQSKYVLEMRADSELSKQIVEGVNLKFVRN